MRNTQCSDKALGILDVIQKVPRETMYAECWFGLDCFLGLMEVMNFGCSWTGVL